MLYYSTEMILSNNKKMNAYVYINGLITLALFGEREKVSVIICQGGLVILFEE